MASLRSSFSLIRGATSATSRLASATSTSTSPSILALQQRRLIHETAPPLFAADASPSSSFPSPPTTSTDSDSDGSGGGGPILTDSLGRNSAKGVTGGGEPLNSSADNAAPKPKISNLSVPGGNMEEKLEQMSEGQRREVEEHNRDFEKKHDRSNAAPDDKVDKNFWKGEGDQ